MSSTTDTPDAPPMTIKLFASDLDGTLLGKPDATLDFHATWTSLPDGRRPVLCYNTGRMLEETRRVIVETGLPMPDYLICGVGTVIFDVKQRKTLKAFSDILDEGWNRKTVEQVVRDTVSAEPQPDFYQSPFKSSWYLHDAAETQIEQLEAALAQAGLDTWVIYSSARDLDVLPKFANKANALEWLLRHLGINPSEALVAGDTGNDSAMFRIKGIRGIVVENAQPELIEATMGRDVFSATHVCAEGVLEGLVHFGVIDEPRRASSHALHEQPHDPEIQQLFDRVPITELSPKRRQYLQTAYQRAVEGLRKCITPKGFSACSLEDNISRGTDQNYHAVWARDGSIAITGSMPLTHDPEVRACQKNTLVTLLDHMSPPGQIPANVNLHSGQPEYMGIGGIASIDSGLWVMIAFYEYVRKTNDLEFLRAYRPKLQRAMDWLSAHDSNNDSLLEIPEASDWMDLFARSYNVLYDEVLWYRANICFGRMLELLGDYNRAGDYIRWSQSIKAAICAKFWPTTSYDPADRPATFADMQYTLGDTNYLLGQVTPFGFDWRCDVYANILALLYNVIDAERAKIAFRFMWGTGVNEPFPVKNIYPPVHAGDPDWKAYYTVNLLNLPDHYHNGGVWPFIGGQWVRFICRLGLPDVAAQELVRVAQLCEKGIAHDWEFNEWAHGKTGRPMGKAFQAWSCSEFILACHELGICDNA